MSFINRMKISESPTLPGKNKIQKTFDIEDLYGGPLDEKKPSKDHREALDERMRKAYFWLTNHAIITPFYDIEYNEEPPVSYRLGDKQTVLTLPSSQSYSSFILLPLLNLVVRKRCLLVGGPGRGKTASAILMGILAGYTMKELKRSIQHGQPQMTISDLLGNPLPSDLMNAKDMDEIKIAWRKWLSMKVKIIDEYNRIPTRTQSALLTVMGDNYAELLDQVYECPEAAWYLTANADEGGGTYQVIEALSDRIDIVVHALHFNTRFLKELLSRIEAGIKPEEMVPDEIIFNEQEIGEMHSQILNVEIPYPLMRRIEFFASHFEFFESAGEQFEYKTKDTLKLSGQDFQKMASLETGKDQIKNIGYQTKNGFSVRTFMTALIFVKALAFFRGQSKVGYDDVRNIVPFVLHDKLIQNGDAQFFERPGNEIYRIDRISWIRNLFDSSCAEYDRQGFDKNDPLRELEEQFGKGLEGVSKRETKKQLAFIERQLETISKGRKIHSFMYDDILMLKYYHQRYTNYLKWLQWKK